MGDIIRRLFGIRITGLILCPGRLFFAGKVVVHHILGVDTRRIAFDHAGNFFHQDDLHAGGNILVDVHAAFAGPDHPDVDDAIFETDVFDIAAFSLQEGPDFVEHCFDLFFHQIRHFLYPGDILGLSSLGRKGSDNLAFFRLVVNHSQKSEVWSLNHLFLGHFLSFVNAFLMIFGIFW